MMADDCKRERLGLKAQTRIPMREKWLRFAFQKSKVKGPKSNTQFPRSNDVGLWTLDFGLLILEVYFQPKLELPRIE
jgi:hypothetical protein